MGIGEVAFLPAKIVVSRSLGGKVRFVKSVIGIWDIEQKIKNVWSASANPTSIAAQEKARQNYWRKKDLETKDIKRVKEVQLAHIPTFNGLSLNMVLVICVSVARNLSRI